MSQPSSQSWFLTMLWSVVAAALGSLITYRMVHADVAEMLAQRPPIAVINEADFVKAQTSGNNADAQVKKGLAEAEAARDTLTQAGYVVLHARAVAGTPAEYIVPPK